MVRESYLDVLEDLGVEVAEVIVAKVEVLESPKLEEGPCRQSVQPVLAQSEDAQRCQVMKRPGAHRVNLVPVQHQLHQIHQASEVVINNLKNKNKNPCTTYRNKLTREGNP